MFHAPNIPIHLEDDFHYCREVVRKNSDQHTLGSLLVPRRLRPFLYAIFAFAKTADEFTGLPGRDDSARLRLLDDWSRRLLQAEAGEPDHPIFRSLAHTLEVTALPATYLHELLIACRMNVTNKRFNTISELEEYCRYAANPIGRIVMHLADEATQQPHQQVPLKIRLSDSICTALMLTHLWQNLGQDPWSGRPLYLPIEEMNRFGVTEEMILARRFTPLMGELMLHLVAETRQLFERGQLLLDMVQWPLRLELATMLEQGTAILDKIEENGGNTLRSKPQLTPWNRVNCLLRALSRSSAPPQT
ncbi:MAG: squalene/phytoene synthase family protein [Magnetococcales bacterium]|nr:squalene/phytoene synthase family protein [Magnetococcales bacterium]MBF0630797.1 squalene/phytoene synthase family protein [Magnetococcales bacterium]